MSENQSHRKGKRKKEKEREREGGCCAIPSPHTHAHTRTHTRLPFPLWPAAQASALTKHKKGVLESLKAVDALLAFK